MDLDHLAPLAPLIEAIHRAKEKADEADRIRNAAHDGWTKAQDVLWNARTALGEAVCALTDGLPVGASPSDR